MQSLPDAYRALVLGASGAIGGAIAAQLRADPRCALVCTPGRDTEPRIDFAVPDSVAEAAAGEEVKTALEAWRAAWSRRDVEAYVGFYAPAFVPSSGGDREAWRENRKSVMKRALDISVEVTELAVALPDTTHATTTFKQTYRSASYRDVVTKTLQWVRVGDRWMINRENSVTPLAGIQ